MSITKIATFWPKNYLCVSIFLFGKFSRQSVSWRAQKTFMEMRSETRESERKYQEWGPGHLKTEFRLGMSWDQTTVSHHPSLAIIWWIKINDKLSDQPSQDKTHTQTNRRPGHGSVLSMTASVGAQVCWPWCPVCGPGPLWPPAITQRFGQPGATAATGLLQPITIPARHNITHTSNSFSTNLFSMREYLCSGLVSCDGRSNAAFLSLLGAKMLWKSNVLCKFWANLATWTVLSRELLTQGALAAPRAVRTWTRVHDGGRGGGMLVRAVLWQDQVQ